MAAGPQLTWKDAAIRVLREARAPLNYGEIADTIVEKRYTTGVGANPSTTVNVVINQSINSEGGRSPFIKVERGVYGLRNYGPVPQPTRRAGPKEPARQETVAEETGEVNVVSSLGMFWSRDEVSWVNPPALLGVRRQNPTPINFSRQKGVYLLHDAQGVVYVGRAIDQSIGVRIYQHTRDRLDGRWTRFSWFGVLDVDVQGALKDFDVFTELNMDDVVSVIEGVLIEALEPRQNMRNGDGFRALEYNQVRKTE